MYVQSSGPESCVEAGSKQKQPSGLDSNSSWKFQAQKLHDDPTNVRSTADAARGFHSLESVQRYLFLNFHVATIRDGGDLPVADRGRDSSTFDSVGLTHHFHRDSTTTIKHELQLKSTLATDPGRFEPLKFAGSVSGRDGNVKVGGRWSGGLTSAEPGSHSLTVLDCLAESPDFHLLKGCSACREDLFVMPLVDLHAVSEISSHLLETPDSACMPRSRYWDGKINWTPLVTRDGNNAAGFCQS